MLFIDLKFFSWMCQSPQSIQKEAANEFRENDLCPVNGLCPHIRVPKMRRSIQRQSQSDQLLMLGPIPLHGIRSTHLSGKPEGYPSLPAGNPVQTLSFGHSGEGFPQYPRACQSDQRLANLCRLCSNPYCESQKTEHEVEQDKTQE